MKSLIALILIFFTFSVHSTDTILIDVITNEYPIHNIVSDNNGRIFFSDKTGVKFIENFTIKEFDKSYSGELIVENGEIVYAEYEIDHGWEKRKKFRENQPQDFLKFLPLSETPSIYSVASLNNLFHFVAVGRKIYVFNTDSRFVRHLKGQSTRKIYQTNNQLFVSTYSGLFLNDVIIDSTNLGGGFLESQGHWLGGSENFIWMYSIGVKSIQKIDSIDISSLLGLEDLDIISLQEYQGYYWVGTNKGLVVLKNDGSIQFKLQNQIIESFNQHKDLLYVTGSKGIFKISEDLKIEKTDVFDIYVNHFLILPDKWILATNSGLFEYQIENRRVKKIELSDPNLIINGIMAAENEYLWISTEKGIFCLNPNDYSFWQFCSNIEFNKRSFFQTEDTFYFGSLDGIFAFNPLNPRFFQNSSLEYFPKKSPGTSIWIWVLGFSTLLVGFFISYFYWNSKKFQTTQTQNLDDPIQIKKLCEEIIRNNIANITVDGLAENIGLNKRTLFRKLEIIGIKPGEIIRNIRKEFLKNKIKEQPHVSLTELSILTGYSENHLLKVLKEIRTDEN